MKRSNPANYVWVLTHDRRGDIEVYETESAAMNAYEKALAPEKRDWEKMTNRPFRLSDSKYWVRKDKVITK
jgi:hypothetical protein